MDVWMGGWKEGLNYLIKFSICLFSICIFSPGYSLEQVDFFSKSNYHCGYIFLILISYIHILTILLVCM